jgi:hypothetical protein
MAQLNQKLTSGSDITLPVVDQLAMYFDQNNKVAFKNVNGDIIPLIGAQAVLSISASFAQTASHTLNVDYTNISNLPTLISASSQVSYPDLSNIPAGILSSSEQINTLSGVSASHALSADQALLALSIDYVNVTNLPTLVSASSQISYPDLSNIPAGIISSSEQINTLSGTSASFAQTASMALNVDYANVSNRPALVSASSQISYAGLSNIPASIVSSSAQVIAFLPAGTLSSSTQINNLSGVSASFATSASRAQTASIALNVDYANVSNRPTLISASSQVSYTGLSNIPANIVSSSNQVIAFLPAGTISSSTQVSYPNISNIPANIVSSSGQVSYTGLANVPAGIVSSSAQINNYNIFATTGSNTFQGNQIFSGSMTITQNLTVFGSSSISYVSQSTLNIGTNIISVNVDNPAVRFGGFTVNDSGSSPIRSGSLLFDSFNDQWIFIHQNVAGGVTSSILVMGPPTFNNVGNETILTQNRLLKGAGLEHITDSQITDDGTNVGIGTSTPGAKLHIQGNVSASAFSGSLTGPLPYTALTGVPSGIVSSSSQISYTGLSNIPAGILSSSTQINNLSGVSASFATSASRAQTASVALNVDYVNVSNRPTLVSASSQVSYT